MERFQNLPTELIFKYKFVAKRDVTISQLGSNIFSMFFMDEYCLVAHDLPVAPRDMLRFYVKHLIQFRE